MISLWTGILILALLGLISGLVLSFAATRYKTEDDPIVNTIDNLLPQSQCGQCGYPGCKPYAEAVANNGELINKCIPGGEAVMLKIADVMGVEPQPLDETAQVTNPARKVVIIDEANCIGCTKCIQVCPVDAIIGSNRTMHTVIESLCTGCELCIPPCPTNCINLIEVKTTPNTWKWQLNTIPVKTDLGNDMENATDKEVQK